jgi:hypothetical protein
MMQSDTNVPTRPASDNSNAAASTAYVTGAIATAIAGLPPFPPSPIPAGTVMVFYQASAPSGWTAVSLNDRALRVVNAGGTGGTTGGTNAFSTVFAQTVVGSHTLALSEIPGHTHTVGDDSLTLSPGGAGFALSGSAQNTTFDSGSAGGGGAHNHTITMAIAYIDVIVCSKN